MRSLLTKSQIIRLEPTAPVAEKKRIIDQEMFGYEDPYLEPNTKMDYQVSKAEIYTNVDDVQKNIESEMRAKCEKVRIQNQNKRSSISMIL